jgi:hypothetical protein
MTIKVYSFDAWTFFQHFSYPYFALSLNMAAYIGVMLQLILVRLTIILLCLFGAISINSSPLLVTSLYFCFHNYLGLIVVTCSSDADKYRSTFVPELEPLGFFPSTRTHQDTNKPRVPLHGGSVPNSAVLKMLYPPSTLSLRSERQQLTSGYRPPVLTAAQSAFLTEFNQQVAFLCLCLIISSCSNK